MKERYNKVVQTVQVDAAVWHTIPMDILSNYKCMQGIL